MSALVNVGVNKTALEISVPRQIMNYGSPILERENVSPSRSPSCLSYSASTVAFRFLMSYVNMTGLLRMLMFKFIHDFVTQLHFERDLSLVATIRFCEICISSRRFGILASDFFWAAWSRLHLPRECTHARGFDSVPNCCCRSLPDNVKGCNQFMRIVLVCNQSFSMNKLWINIVCNI